MGDSLARNLRTELSGSAGLRKKTIERSRPGGPTIKVLNGYLPLQTGPETLARAPMYEAAVLNQSPETLPGRGITGGAHAAKDALKPLGASRRRSAGSG